MTRSWYAAEILACAAAVALWLWFLDAPFQCGVADAIGEVNSIAAENHLRYGYAVTRLGQVGNLEPASPEQFVYYRSHPPTLVVLLSLVFRVTGSSAPWAARLLPLLATVATFLVLHRLAARLLAPPGGCAAVVAFASSGGVLVHGVNAAYEPLVVLALLATVLAEHAGRRRLALGLLVAGGLVDFPGLYAAPYLAWRSRRAPRALLMVLLAASLPLLVHVAHVASLPPAEGPGVFGYVRDLLGMRYLAAAQSLGGPRSAGEWLERIGSHLVAACSWPGLCLWLCGLWLRDAPVRLLLLAGVLHVVVFPVHAFAHDFWVCYLGAAFALAAGAAATSGPRSWRGVAVVLMLASGVLGWRQACATWRARGDPRPRLWGAALRHVAEPEEIVFLMADLPPWSVARLRGHPVEQSTFLQPDDFRLAAALLRGHGQIDRPLKLFVPLEWHSSADAQRFLAERFAGCFEGWRADATLRFAVYDLGPALRGR